MVKNKEIKTKTVKSKASTKDVLRIINDGCTHLTNNWALMISATALAMVSVFAWLLFPSFGIALMAFATGFVSLGYIKFVVDIIEGKNVQFESIYSYYKISVKAFALRLVMCVNVALWTLLLIVPGVICALNYSFAMSALCQDKKLTVLGAIEKSKELTRGHRLEILCVYLLWIMMLILVFGAVSATMATISLIVEIEPWIIFLVGGIVTLVAEIMLLMPLKQFCLSSIFVDSKNYLKSKKTKKAQMVEETAQN